MYAASMQKGCYFTNGHSAKVYTPANTILLEYFADEKPLRMIRKVAICVLARYLLGFANELINPRKVRMYNARPPTPLALIIRYPVKYGSTSAYNHKARLIGGQQLCGGCST